MHGTKCAFIDAELAQAHDDPAVVATQHAPHSDSLPSAHDHLAWCDASDLSAMIEAQGLELRVHVHILRDADYRVGRARIVSNPRGHVEEATAFVPDLVGAVS